MSFEVKGDALIYNAHVFVFVWMQLQNTFSAVLSRKKPKKANCVGPVKVLTQLWLRQNILAKGLDALDSTRQWDWD